MDIFAECPSGRASAQYLRTLRLKRPCAFPKNVRAHTDNLDGLQIRIDSDSPRLIFSICMRLVGEREYPSYLHQVRGAPEHIIMGSCVSFSQNNDSSTIVSTVVTPSLDRPCDVTCSQCNAANYLDARKSAAKCFKCRYTCYRSSRTAKEIKKIPSRFDLNVEENVKQRMLNALPCSVGG